MEKPDQNRADWSNYWKGRAAGQTGEVFAGVGIETSRELVAHWQAVFADVGGAVIVDIACGAGSALKHAVGRGADRLVGLDISEHAVASARDAVPGLLGITGSADRIPLADGVADLVVSQFGFEYADRRAAAAEIARILKPSGRFVAVTHMQGGAIAAECAGHLAMLDRVEASGFIDATRTLFSALYRMDRAGGQASEKASEKASEQASEKASAEADVRAALSRFQAAQAAIMPSVQAGGLAAHLHGGARQLYERRRAYAEQDVAGWLDGMASEIAAYRGRMAAMLNAALPNAEAMALLEIVSPDGGGRVTPVHLAGDAAAYCLDVTRAG